jgi:hypothetical protein
MLSRLSSFSRAAGGRAAYSSSIPSSFGFELSEDTKSYQQLARKFAKEEIIPVAAKYDQSMEYPTAVFKKAWEVNRRVSFSLCLCWCNRCGLGLVRSQQPVQRRLSLL